MSEIAATLALGSEYTFKGRTFQVAPCCYKIMGLFEKHLQALSRATISEAAADTPDYVVREMLSTYQKDCAARVYHFDGTVAARARTLVPGRKYLAVLQLHKGSGGLTLDEATNLVEYIFDSEDSDIESLEKAMDEANALPNQAKPYHTTI